MVKAVSLHVFTNLQGKTYAVCQVRGRHNFEDISEAKFGRSESWAGGLQPLVHGKLEEVDEGYPVACLMREASQEVGTDFSSCALHPNAHLLVDAGVHNDVQHFYLRMHARVIDHIRLHPSTGGLRLVSHSDLSAVVDLKKCAKDKAVPSDVIAMFTDDSQVMQEVFTKILQ